MTNARLTLDSATLAATNINAAIQSLTAFVQFVTPTNSSSTSTRTNSVPFNILDYGTAATQIGAAAGNLQSLLTTANQSLPQVQKISDQMTASADLVIWHAFWMGLVLIFILLAGSVCAALIYRSIANKLADSRHKSSEPKS